MAALSARLIKNKRNGYHWGLSSADQPERDDTVAVIEGVASGAVSEEELATWAALHMT